MAIIGLDLGGTKISGALFNESGEVLYEVWSLLNESSHQHVGNLICSLLYQLIDYSNDLDLKVDAVGICVPGIVNIKTRTVWAPNIDGWDDYPLHDELTRCLKNEHIKISIASDRTCYILGEKWKGVAQNATNAIYISVGTGIGAGLMVDGKIVHGQGDISGAIGWSALETPFSEAFTKCGCFESYASGAGIANHAKRLMEEKCRFSNSLMYQYTKDNISAKEVFEAYFEQDPLATVVIEKAIELWAMASANLVSLLNPEIIVWGGGVFGPAIQLIEHIYERAIKWAQPIAITQVRFEKSALDGRAGLYGAGFLALTSYTSNTPDI